MKTLIIQRICTGRQFFTVVHLVVFFASSVNFQYIMAGIMSIRQDILVN